MSIFKKQRLGIDLGTANTVMYLEGKGIVLREPTMIARDMKTKALIAFGKEAKDLLGKTSENIEIIYPIQKGVIHHFDLTKQLLTYFIKKVSVKAIGRPEVVIAAPSNISKVERKAFIDAIRELGVHRAMIAEAPFAAAIGANIHFFAPLGRLMVDIGGGTTDIATLSYGEIVDKGMIPVGTQQMNQMIMTYVREHLGMIIGPQTAEDLKNQIGNAAYDPNEMNESVSVKGIDIATRAPIEKTVPEELVAQALNEVIEHITMKIREVLSVTPPELAADILSHGMSLCGGGALLKRLPERIQQDVGVPVNIVSNPMDVVAIGAGQLLDQMQHYSKQIELSNR